MFSYDVIVELNHEEMEKHLETISKIKSFISKYIWKEINYSSEKYNCKYNLTTTLNVSYEKEMQHFQIQEKL